MKSPERHWELHVFNVGILSYIRSFGLHDCMKDPCTLGAKRYSTALEKKKKKNCLSKGSKKNTLLARPIYWGLDSHWQKARLWILRRLFFLLLFPQAVPGVHQELGNLKSPRRGRTALASRQRSFQSPESNKEMFLFRFFKGTGLTMPGVLKMESLDSASSCLSIAQECKIPRSNQS